MALSRQAEKLLARVKNPRYWYRAYGKRVPKAMEELVAAGLVEIGARTPIIAAYYVPKGYSAPDFLGGYPTDDPVAPANAVIGR